MDFRIMAGMAWLGLAGVALAGTAEEEIGAAHGKGLYAVVVLHGEDEAEGAELFKALEPMTGEAEKVGACLKAAAGDPGLAPLLEELKLDPGTIPTPVALVIAPNKLVTGVFMDAPGKEKLEAALLPDEPLAIRKALAEGKNVIVTIQSAETEGNEATLKAVEEFLGEEGNAEKFAHCPLALDKPENLSFLKKLKIDPAKEQKSVVLGMKPPLRLVGNEPFRGEATQEDVRKAVDPACAPG